MPRCSFRNILEQQRGRNISCLQSDKIVSSLASTLDISSIYSVFSQQPHSKKLSKPHPNTIHLHLFNRGDSLQPAVWRFSQLPLACLSPLEEVLVSPSRTLLTVCEPPCLPALPLCPASFIGSEEDIPMAYGGESSEGWTELHQRPDIILGRRPMVR